MKTGKEEFAEWVVLQNKACGS